MDFYNSNNVLLFVCAYALAAEHIRSSDNAVHVQYTYHVPVCSIIRQWGAWNIPRGKFVAVALPVAYLTSLDVIIVVITNIGCIVIIQSYSHKTIVVVVLNPLP